MGWAHAGPTSPRPGLPRAGLLGKPYKADPLDSILRRDPRGLDPRGLVSARGRNPGPDHVTGPCRGMNPGTRSCPGRGPRDWDLPGGGWDGTP
jgi:hypothetical protein